MRTQGTSFARLVAEHERSVLGLCRSIVRDEHLSRDAAQEAFVRLWQRLAGGAQPVQPVQPTHIGAWLRQAALSASLDLLRRRRVRRDAGQAATLDAASELPSALPQPHTELAMRELEERLERALEVLPDGQRSVFLLRHSAGLSLGEIAATLGVSVPTVKTQFARACLRLQTALRPFDEGSKT